MAVTHLADDGMAAVNADAHAQRLSQVTGQRGIQFLQTLRHPLGGLEGRTAGLSDLRVDSEKGHHAVTDELVDPAARCLHRRAHGGEIAIEDEDHVEGQLVFRQAGKAPEVGEEYGDLALLALQGRSLAHQLGGRHVRRQQGCHLQVRQGQGLAGQTNVGGGVETGEHP